MTKRLTEVERRQKANDLARDPKQPYLFEEMKPDPLSRSVYIPPWERKYPNGVGMSKRFGSKEERDAYKATRKAALERERLEKGVK